MKTLGHISPDPYAERFGTGFSRFVSPTGCDGLCRVKGRAVDVLAIDSRKHGRGMFRNFIAQLKAEADQITFMAIYNPKLEVILARYGFQPVNLIEQHSGGKEQVNGMRWKKEKC